MEKLPRFDFKKLFPQSFRHIWRLEVPDSIVEDLGPLLRPVIGIDRLGDSIPSSRIRSVQSHG